MPPTGPPRPKLFAFDANQIPCRGSANVRYIVDDVDAAIEFYRDRLGFVVQMHPAPGFAALMPAGVSWFAENQPFTPMIETLRGLLTGTPIGNAWILAIGWCLVITTIGYTWARKSYNGQRPA